MIVAATWPHFETGGFRNSEVAYILLDSDVSIQVSLALCLMIDLILVLCFHANRDALQKFFYPFDYQELSTTKPLEPGQRRVHTGLDVKFTFECDTTLDILFSKNRVCAAITFSSRLKGIEPGHFKRTTTSWKP